MNFWSGTHSLAGQLVIGKVVEGHVSDVLTIANMHLGLIYSARAVDDPCHALHPGSRQPTLAPTHDCCLSFTDCVGM